MDTQSLPIVPFGKYKGQSITNLLNDTKYLEWCKQQEWFQKFPIVYNICVNQTMITNNQNSKTPEHNKLQNLFLDNLNVEKILRKVYNNFKYKKNVNYGDARCEFEGMFNWDIIIEGLYYNKSLCICNWAEKDEGSSCDCDKGYENNDDSEYELSNVYIEVKPLLGDDYPCVLRKMKTQIELTRLDLRKTTQDVLKKLGYEEGCMVFGKNRLEIRDIIKNKEQTDNGNYILLIGEFNSGTTSKEMLIKIFNQSFIKVLFINKLFDVSIPIQIHDNFKSIQPQFSNLDDNLLREKLTKAEDKIKQLEEEILSLKTKKQGKNMIDYFGKK